VALRRTIFLLALALVTVTAAAGSAAARMDRGTWCGRVSSKYGKFKVEVLRGEVGCGTARHVIRYVLTHGPATQGAPGKSPPHWSCGWGYGFFHGHRNQGRSGPLCTHRGDEVEGTGPEFTQEPTARLDPGS
jgi:hypothetical protein